VERSDTHHVTQAISPIMSDILASGERRTCGGSWVSLELNPSYGLSDEAIASRAGTIKSLDSLFLGHGDLPIVPKCRRCRAWLEISRFNSSFAST
jgi:hypothetical protein